MTPAWCRRPLQRPVSSAVSCSRFISGLEAVVEDAVRWLHTRDNTGDLLGCLYKVFMEVTGAVTLDHRSALSMLGSLLTRPAQVRLSARLPGPGQPRLAAA